MKITHKGIQITLTKEQIEEIERQQSRNTKYKTFTDITCYSDACDYLKEDVNSDASEIEQIQTIAKAINELDNVVPKYNWYPYFNLNPYGGFVRFINSGGCCSYFGGEVAFTKSKESSNHLGRVAEKLYLALYNKIKVI